ncbi:MAG: hypothetical protein U1E28_15425 [Beijerinckiaceae bacterium]
MIVIRFPDAGRCGPFLAVALALIQPTASSAQLQLPGAFNPAPEGTVGAPDGGIPKPKRVGPPPPPKVPPDEAVIGRVLMLNGKAGLIEFRRDGKEFQVSRLKLPGDQISRPGEPCEVDVAAPIALKSAGKPQGVNRYQLDLPACSFAVDVLDGAVMASRDGGVCEFQAAGCRVDPSGLWGQPANEIGPQRSKEIEGQRRHAEQDMQAAYRAWVASAGHDRVLVSRIARGQASFSSKREELCRTYARESQHGYCNLIATQARSSAIAAHVLPPVVEEEKPASKKSRRR